MLTWLVLLPIAICAAAVLVRPLLWRAPAERHPSGEEHVSVYAGQLEELERDAESGLIGATETEAARAEIGRRLLRAARERMTRAGSARRRPVWAIGLAVAVPVVSLALYAAYGAPGYGDQPRAARVAPTDTPSQLPTLLARAEERLRKTPGDGAGWAVVAPIYLRMRRFDDAVEAYRNAVRLLGEEQAFLAGLGEALTMRERGVVGPEARAAFEKALVLDPDSLGPRIFLAIAARQAGRTGEARMAWNALLADTEGDEPWLPLARHELALLGDDAVASAVAAPNGRAGAGEVSPSPSGGAAAALAPQDDGGARQAMIEGMVARLATRLDSEGGSSEEYIRLARSYVVLGRRDDAARWMERGLEAFAAKPDEQLALRQAASALGLAVN